MKHIKTITEFLQKYHITPQKFAKISNDKYSFEVHGRELFEMYKLNYKNIQIDNILVRFEHFSKYTFYCYIIK